MKYGASYMQSPAGAPLISGVAGRGGGGSGGPDLPWGRQDDFCKSCKFEVKILVLPPTPPRPALPLPHSVPFHSLLLYLL